MIPSNLTKIYEKIASKTGQSSLVVRQGIMEVFKVLKEMMSTYPEHSGFLLNKLGNIEVKASAVKNLLKKRIMNDEQRVKWEEVLVNAAEFKDTKKLSTKRKLKEEENERLQEQDLCDGDTIDNTIE